MTSILSLKVGDRVCDSRGVSGTVAGFARNHVLVRWDGEGQPVRLTDADLRTVTRVATVDVVGR